MKVTYTTPKPTAFKDLEEGEWFTEDGDLYMKFGKEDAITLEGQRATQYTNFKPDTEVFKVAEVLITLE